MTKEEFYAVATPGKFKSIADQLNDDERDVFKYKISKLCVEQLVNNFDIDSNPTEVERLNTALECLSIIHPYSHRIPEYGLAYKGRPDFMTDELLSKLQQEATKFREEAVINLEQFITCAETLDKSSVAETLEDMQELNDLVEKHAGKCLPSFISNYIYYDEIGHCSKPHVDNGFTAVTVMIALKHESNCNNLSSSSVAYWPKKIDLITNSSQESLQFSSGQALFTGEHLLAKRSVYTLYC
ncbi:hypothetical protein [Niabella hibiscisoli]|uniref:hypothetical protein n=1 Tax=Niabella hibiscisoli TaxID=1825928 RepID=UPI001F11401C|nr:hypothetical protein [Niabella hibiscisoli]MCH5716677.1 hypothetical protein [Niabella hibiscisoli]